MQFVPWQNIADWHCRACGYCCKLYNVVINFKEWLNIAKSFGVEITVTGLDRFFIKRASDDDHAHSSATMQKITAADCKTRNLKHAKSGPSKYSPNLNTANPTKQHMTTAECDCTFMETTCAAVCGMALQHGISVTQK